MGQKDVYGKQTDRGSGRLATQATSCFGFTLIELVIVLLITAILAAVVTPKFFSSLWFHRAESASRRVKLDLQMARNRAKAASATQTVQFDSATHSYVVPGLADLDHPDSQYKVDLTKYPYQAQIVSVDFGGDEQVSFDRFGLPDSGGTILVKSGPEQRTVSIEATSGQVTIP